MSQHAVRVASDHCWTGETPLWLYILKEAEVFHASDGWARE